MEARIHKRRTSVKRDARPFVVCIVLAVMLLAFTAYQFFFVRYLDPGDAIVDIITALIIGYFIGLGHCVYKDGPDTPHQKSVRHAVSEARMIWGECKVICTSPQTDESILIDVQTHAGHKSFKVFPWHDQFNDFAHLQRDQLIMMVAAHEQAFPDQLDQQPETCSYLRLN